MFGRDWRFYLDEGSGGGGQGQAQGQSQQGHQSQQNAKGEGETLTFDTWQKSLPDEQKGLIEGHVKGLKSALDSERGSRRDLETKLRELAKKADEGSEAKTQLTKLADDLQLSDRRGDFYEAAHNAGVKNLKLAYTVAMTDEMFDKHGRVNFDEMKKSYPELFASTTTPRGNAGSGTETGQPKDNDMNARIRRLAGRQ